MSTTNFEKSVNIAESIISYIRGQMNNIKEAGQNQNLIMNKTSPDPIDI